MTRMWRKENLCTLLMAMSVSTAIMKNSMKFPQKNKKRTNYWLYYPKEMKSVCGRDTCTPMLVAALFTIAKVWNLSAQ
jgi:hypothetical protein